MTISHPLTIRRPAEGRAFGVVGDVYRFLVTGDETGGRYALWETVVAPAEARPRTPTAARRRGSTCWTERSPSGTAMK